VMFQGSGVFQFMANFERAIPLVGNDVRGDWNVRLGQNLDARAASITHPAVRQTTSRQRARCIPPYDPATAVLAKAAWHRLN
jgi:hypothetical protein